MMYLSERVKVDCRMHQSLWIEGECDILCKLNYYSLSYDLFKTMSRIGHKMISDTDDRHGYPYEHPFSHIVLQ
jgi:hypothetical protein